MDRYGPVAQLGECYIRIVEVVGSTPIRSTKQKSDEHLLFLHRRLRREGENLTKQKEPRLEMTLVFYC